MYARQRRRHADARHPQTGIGRELERQRLEIDEQRIRRRIVGAQRFAVESSGIVRGQIKRRVVEHQIAIDGVHARLAHLLQQQPKPFHHQFGVSLAPDIQIAPQCAIVQAAVGPYRGAPDIRGAQNIERCSRSHQLHHRRRIHRRAGMQIDQRCAAIGWRHQQAYL